MKTYTFIVNNKTVAHVDVNNNYGYREARALILKVFPSEKVKFLPVIIIYGRKIPQPGHTNIPFIPFGYVNTLEPENWKEYIYG